MNVEMIQLKIFKDDRGSLAEVFNDNLPFMVRRTYVIAPKTGIIRGLHGHNIEWKAFYVPMGKVKFGIVPIRNIADRNTFTLQDTNQNLLIVPPEHYNGFIALKESIVICFSSLSLEASQQDDFRVDPYHFGDIWK